MPKEFNGLFTNCFTNNISMDAEKLLEKILNSNKVEDAKGNVYDLNSNLNKEEGIFIQQLIDKNKPLNTLEIGCAYGVSSLYICSKLPTGSQHIIIDPNQSTDWKNIGIENLEKAGLKNFKLYEGPSEIILPGLLNKGQKLDFALIDGWHTLDHTLIDFFYINKMLNIGGIVVIDDVAMEGIKKIMRYIINYPCFKLIDAVNIKYTLKRKLFHLFIEKPFSFIAGIFPSRIAYRIFASNIVKNEKKLNLNASMIALQKTSEDTRPWNWYNEF